MADRLNGSDGFVKPTARRNLSEPTRSGLHPAWLLLLLILLPLSGPAQSDPLIRARPDFQNQFYLATPSNAPGTALAQPPSVALYSGAIGDATNVANVANAAPNDGQVFLTHAAIGLSFFGEPFNPAAPSIARQPRGGTALAGQFFALSAVVPGDAPLSYQWRFNGVPLSGQTNFALFFTTPRTSDSGQYDLVVTNIVGSVTSDVVSLVVNPLPANRVVAGWGDNGSGQITVPVAAQSGVIAIAAEANHTLALRDDGTVLAWGNNSFGQANVPAGLSGVAAVAAGGVFTLALKSDGTVAAWGQNIYGETNLPVAARSGVVQIAAGNGHGLALKGDGTVVAWGKNDFNQAVVPPGLNQILAVAAVGDHSLALRTGGSVVAWGVNNRGQTNVPASASNVLALAGTDAHSLALRSDGTVVAWGQQFVSVSWVSASIVVPPGLNGLASITSGRSHDLGLKDDGTVLAWGVGNGEAQANMNLPTGLRGVLAVAAGASHSVVLMSGPPAIRAQPAGVTAAAGTNATFALDAIGPGPLSYFWFRNGTLVSAGTNGTLVLSNAQPALAGNYTVVVSNAFGSVTSQVATLSVQTMFAKILVGPVVNDGAVSYGAAWGDYDGDGYPDLFVAGREGGANFLYHNNGNGTFTRVLTNAVATDTARATGGTWADFDNDGDLDLFVFRDGGVPNTLYRNDGNGAFTAVAGAGLSSPGNWWSGSWGDFDRDGWLDVFTLNYGDVHALYRNNHNGTFASVSPSPVVIASAGVSAAWADYDGDADLDLILANTGQAIKLFRNDGASGFTLQSAAFPNDVGNWYGLAWGDYDNDGWTDVAVANDFAGKGLFHNNGNGTFTRILTGAVPQNTDHAFGAVWLDYDNDGWLDLFFSGNDGGNELLFRNDGHGGFVQITLGALVTSGGDSTGAAWADYNRDGFPDLFVSNRNGENDFLYRNEGNSNAWLSVACITAQGQRGGIGAKVRVRATIAGTNVWQMREISGGSGYASQNSLDQIIGLGDATNVTTLRIEWPSGQVMEFANVARNQLLTVTESSLVLRRTSLALAVGARGAFEALPGTNLFTYQWRFNGTNLPGETNRVLGFPSAVTGQAGDYVLRAFSASGMVEWTAHLDVVSTLSGGVVADYHLDGNGLDSGPNALHGSLSGPTATTDRFGFAGRALFFNGAGAEVVIPDSPEWYLGASNFTIAVWARLQSAGNFALVTQYAEPSGASQFQFTAYDGHYYFHTVWSDLNQVGAALTPPPGLYAGQWKHIGVIRNGSSIRFILDGRTFLGNVSTTSGPLNDGSEPIRIGGRGHRDLWFYGAMDELQVWKRALTDLEVAALFASESSEWLAFTQQPQSATNAVGFPLSLNVAATGVGTLHYQWRFNGTNLVGATNTTFGITNARPFHSGAYSVVVSNSFGSITSQVAQVQVVWQAAFTKIASGPVPADTGDMQNAVWADFDNDGFADLFIAKHFSTSNALFHNNRNGTFSRIFTGPVVTDLGSFYGAAAGDYDNDGFLDLFVSNSGDPSNLLYRNQGDGTFVKVAAAKIASPVGESVGCAWADYDRDGYLDLFVSRAGPGEPSLLYHNNRDGSFTAVVAGDLGNEVRAANGCAWGDYDNDGYPDLFVVTRAGGHLLYHNNGNSTFTRVTSSPYINDLAYGAGCAWGDYDNDGFLDLYVANSSVSGPNFLYHNNGNGSFTRITAGAIAAEEAVSIGCAWGDFNKDGFLDLFVTRENGGQNSLWRNNGDGTFTKVTTGLPSEGGHSRGGVWADYDHDGNLDLAVANDGGLSLYHNDGNGGSWLSVHLVGAASNRSAIGAKVRLATLIDGRTVSQLREISGGSSYGSQNELTAFFGLGDATNITTLRIEWPSGKVQTFSNVAPRQFLTIQEQTTFSFAVNGSGSVSYSPVRSNYYIGEPIVLTATPRNTNWTRFLRWSDGNTNATRTVAIGLTNAFTAIFTNLPGIALETNVFKHWEASFGGVGSESANWVEPTSDGGFLVGGISNSGPGGNKLSPGFGSNDVWLVKVDAEGLKQWERVLGGSGEDFLYSIRQTPDGGFIMAGHSDSPGNDGNKLAPNFGSADGWLVKLDSAGQRVWDKTFGGINVDVFHSLDLAEDGGFILGGYSKSGVSGNKETPNQGFEDFWIVKVDSSGNKQWERDFGGTAGDGIYSVRQTRDGGFIMGGSTISQASGNKTSSLIGGTWHDAWVIKLDRFGNKSWERAYGGTSSDFCQAIELAPEGGFHLGGYSVSGPTGNKTSPNFGTNDYWLVKISGAGDVEWDRSYGGADSDILWSMGRRPNGELILAGNSYSTNGPRSGIAFGQNDYWIIGTDSQGNTLWSQTYGGSNFDILISVAATLDDGFVVAGYSNSEQSGNKLSLARGQFDFWVIKSVIRETLLGTPAVLVNGLYSPSNSFAIPATNAISVEIRTTFTNASVFFTLDDSDPSGGELYSGPFTVSNAVVVRAIAYTEDFSESQTNDAVRIDVVPLYALTVTTPGGGSVSNSVAGPHLSNSVVTLTATTLPGWQFMNWTGDAAGTNPVLNVTMDRARTVQAIFGAPINVTVSGAGTVSREPASGPYPFGSAIRLTPVPNNATTYFRQWGSAANGQFVAPLNFVITNANPTVSAVFATLPGTTRSLTVLISGNGSVTKSPQQSNYANNATVTLTAGPDAGRVFAGWSGDASGTSTQTNVSMNANKTVTATFTVPPIVTITGPMEGALLTTADFPVTTTASDADGSVAKVDFFDGSRFIATRFSPPFDFVLNNAAVGSHTLRVVATDNLGAVASNQINVTVSVPPPIISSFSPQTGPTGSVVTIAGANFAANPTDNIVYFGGVRASVLGGTTNSLAVTVPTGPAFAPLSVTAHGLTAYSMSPFGATFNSARVIDAGAFAPKSDLNCGGAPHAVALGDLDGDGKLDIVVTATVGFDPAYLAVYRNTGSNSRIASEAFGPRVDLARLGRDNRSVALADVDGDGKLDIVTTVFVGGSGPNLFVLKNVSAPGTLTSNSFAAPVSFHTGNGPQGVAVSDLDGDGKPDIIVANTDDDSIAVFRNTGQVGVIDTNSFTTIPVVLSAVDIVINVVVTDLDRDGKPDIAAGGGSTNVIVFRNATTGPGIADDSFSLGVNFASNGGYSLAAGDLDGDDRPEIVQVPYASSGSRLAIIKNTSAPGGLTSSSFASPIQFVTPASMWAVAIGDMDGDGKPDLVTTSEGAQSVRVMQNTSVPGSISTSSFADAVSFETGVTPEAVAIGDLDGDGKPDLLVANYGSGAPGTLSLFWNSMPFSLPPSVVLANPTNGSSFNTPATIELSASATDSDGTVTNVSFYFAGTNFIGRATITPFNFTWTGVAAGSYTLTAVAMDNSGLSATSSAPVNITVNATGNQPPLASLIAPTNGAVFAVGENVTLTASAVDPDGVVARVEFYHGGTILIGIASNGVAGQFSVVWSNVAAGSYLLTARAFDNGGASTVSAAAGVTVLLFEGPPAFRFEQAGYIVGEGDGTMTLRVVRNFSGFATVNYATGDGSANSGADYNAAAGQLQFQSGESAKTIPVTILEDFVVEGNHTFTVTLSLPSSGGLASPSVATATITDNDVQTGSSFLSIVPPSAINTNDLGSLRVYLTGDAGLGGWRLPWERFFRASGTAATGLQPGEYAIEFKPLSGYLPPPPATLAVARAAETRSTNAYTFLVSTPAGSLTVFIDPSELATNADPNCRALWRIAGGAYTNSGATIASLPAGSYTVEFLGLPVNCGWGTPATREVTVRPGVSNSFRASYFTNVAGPSTPLPLNFANDIQNSYANQQPFTFAGQVVTEFGEGSGVVVKERVVLTAAHVVFDDYSLAWAGNAQWFFQRHAPDYNPAPQEVRGYYVNSGYAAQRQAEGTPGVSQPASFDLDVAALYFYAAAGRGGYGGYLVSETPSPQWLQTNALKALVGYPVEGVAPANLGKMHSIGPTSMSFNQTTGTVFTCTQIRGLPGNSGGPLCVKFGGNNFFYPAGIYVGGSDRAIVRAIDSRAVEVINLAELTSNLGTNQSGGVIRFGVILPPGTCYQAAYVLLQPAAARLAGAQWQVHYKLGSPALSPWTSSSTTAILLNNKPDYLDLAPAEGFLTPDTTDYTLGCVTTNLVFTYVQVLPRLDPLAADGRHLVLSGITNRTYRVEYNGRIGVTNGWSTLTNITFTANNNIAVISNALHNLPTNRFYRAVRVP